MRGGPQDGVHGEEREGTGEATPMALRGQFFPGELGTTTTEELAAPPARSQCRTPLGRPLSDIEGHVLSNPPFPSRVPSIVDIRVYGNAK